MVFLEHSWAPSLGGPESLLLWTLLPKKPGGPGSHLRAVPPLRDQTSGRRPESEESRAHTGRQPGGGVSPGRGRVGELVERVCLYKTIFCFVTPIAPFFLFCFSANSFFEPQFSPLQMGITVLSSSDYRETQNNVCLGVELAQLLECLLAS